MTPLRRARAALRLLCLATTSWIGPLLDGRQLPTRLGDERPDCPILDDLAGTCC